MSQSQTQTKVTSKTTYDIISDLSTLSTIPEKTLGKLSAKVVYCICDAVAEALAEDASEDRSVDLDIGIGTLSIGLVDDAIKYKFVPNETLETSVKQTVLNERNLLEDALEKSFVDKITNVYKELI